MMLLCGLGCGLFGLGFGLGFGVCAGGLGRGTGKGLEEEGTGGPAGGGLALRSGSFRISCGRSLPNRTLGTILPR